MKRRIGFLLVVVGFLLYLLGIIAIGQEVNWSVLWLWSIFTDGALLVSFLAMAAGALVPGAVVHYIGYRLSRSDETQSRMPRLNRSMLIPIAAVSCAAIVVLGAITVHKTFSNSSLVSKQEKNNFSTTYDDCILENIGSITSTAILATLKNSCKQKYPMTFDFSEIAREAGSLDWSEVIAHPAYEKLSPQDRESARNQYFTDVIKPQVHPDFIDEAKERFNDWRRRIENQAKQ